MYPGIFELTGWGLSSSCDQEERWPGTHLASFPPRVLFPMAQLTYLEMAVDSWVHEAQDSGLQLHLVLEG